MFVLEQGGVQRRGCVSPTSSEGKHSMARKNAASAAHPRNGGCPLVHEASGEEPARVFCVSGLVRECDLLRSNDCYVEAQGHVNLRIRYGWIEPSGIVVRKNVAPVKSVPFVCALRRLTSVRFACERLACLRSAPKKEAPVKFIPERVAPWRCAPLNFAFLTRSV